MEVKKYRNVYIFTSIILNILFTIVTIGPFFIALIQILSNRTFSKIGLSMRDKMESFAIILFTIVILFGINFLLYKLISKKAKLKRRWLIVPVMTIVITYILIIGGL